MKKFLFLILFLIMLPVFVFSGCSDPVAEEHGGSDRFYHICYSECCVFVDKETRVMYMWRKIGYSGGLTVMVDSDGQPLIFEGEFV